MPGSSSIASLSALVAPGPRLTLARNTIDRAGQALPASSVVLLTLGHPHRFPARLLVGRMAERTKATVLRSASQGYPKIDTAPRMIARLIYPTEG